MIANTEAMDAIEENTATSCTKDVALTPMLSSESLKNAESRRRLAYESAARIAYSALIPQTSNTGTAPTRVTMAAATAGCGRWATRPERPGPPESCPAVCAPEGPVCWNCSAGTVCGGRENGSSCCGCCWLSGVWISSCWPEVCCCDRWLLSELSSRCCGPCEAADWVPADWDSRWDCEA